jgi:DNA repair protein RadA/Sms
MGVAKETRQYVCNSCGAVSTKWQGQCLACNEWNTMSEEAPLGNSAPKGMGGKKGRLISFTDLSAPSEGLPRWQTGMPELDRTLGGGIVPGSALLVGGDPGIGKSTLLLQLTGALAINGMDCIYVSGEEAADQVRLRALRLGVEKASVRFAAETNLRNILTSLDKGKAPQLVIIDSIQTMYLDNLESAPGTVSQVRACAAELIRFAKSRGTAVILVGHVTKDGQIAGPRVLEHMVDTVLYFEGDRGHQFRILRAVKNRFGGTDEIGVFEMTQAGLEQVANPSSLFLSARDENVSGAAVFAGIEGSRPVLVEIQALVAPTAAANPRRAVVGWDSGRLAMILAVLDARLGFSFSTHDVYLNVAGGLKISEPGADLAVAAALISSLSDVPLEHDTVVFGEIALSGEIRPVPQSDLRMKESQKLGFKTAITPKVNKKNKANSMKRLEMGKVVDLPALFNISS